MFRTNHDVMCQTVIVTVPGMKLSYFNYTDLKNAIEDIKQTYRHMKLVTLVVIF